MNLRPIKVVSDHVGNRAKDVGGWAKLYEQAHERLLARIKEYDPPPLASVPAQDCVTVYRFPTKPKATETEGGILIPDAHQKEQTPFSAGLLICAGAEALDVLASHGILPGDIVRWAWLAGDEEDVKRVDEALAEAAARGLGESSMRRVAMKARDDEMAKKKLLRLKAPDIHESVDLLERLYGDKPTMEFVREVSPNGDFTHVIRPVIENLL